jgi:predicted DCC family thiol-disulfide oxidoreductase YuxK
MSAPSSSSSATASPVLLFDGMCNLCTGAVGFVLAHEAEATLRFAPIQSPAGARLMRDFGFDPADAKTFVLIADRRIYVRSDAAVRLARYLRGMWKLLGLIRVVPRPVRDFVYDLVARNRYRWFGRRDACMVPTRELKARFVED